MTGPTVSILLPCLNARQFLDVRIDSLLAQSYSDWEAIVLDSGSTDGSWELFESVASRDSRFTLHQIPREGLYEALNRGIPLARGKFVHIATCDDTMRPEFLARLIEALAICPEAGIAASDLLFINRDGDELTPADLAGYLPEESISDLFALGVVPTSRLMEGLNYRQPPHDSLMHFSVKSVYFSLTQLLVRTAVARANGRFDNTIGSIGDIKWLLRLTNSSGTVHVPERLAAWRFHGNQLSVQGDSSKLPTLMPILKEAAEEIYRHHHPLLTRNDRAALVLPCKRYLAGSTLKRMRCWAETVLRSLRMLIERPSRTAWAMRATRFRPGNIRQTFLPMFMQRLKLSPRPVSVAGKSPPESGRLQSDRKTQAGAISEI
jgi:glycosyltransferase involved in cell wall biosynthesis